VQDPTQPFIHSRFRSKRDTYSGPLFRFAPFIQQALVPRGNIKHQTRPSQDPKVAGAAAYDDNGHHSLVNSHPSIFDHHLETLAFQQITCTRTILYDPLPYL